METLTILKDARSFETAHKTENYPYGFRLKTTMYSWIEHTKQGSRLVQQTINPKNGKLNAPKKSTYDAFKLLALDENGHITTISYSKYSSAEKVQEFLEKYSAYMTESEIREAKARAKIQNLISQKWDEAKKEAEEKTYKPIDDIGPGQLIPSKELTNYAGRCDLWEISLSGNVLEPRCKKEKFKNKPLAYLKRGEELTAEQARDIIKLLESEIQSTLAQYKSHRMNLNFDEVTYQNEGGTMFHSISRMLFSATKLSFNV